MTKKIIIRQSFFSAKLSDLVFFMGRKYKTKILPVDFNASLYLELYPDVAAANVDAAEHYISQGVREGRAYRHEGLPDDFNTKAYLELHPDVLAAKLDPIEHYLSYGIEERRAYKPGQIRGELDVRNCPNPKPDTIVEQFDGAEHSPMPEIMEGDAGESDSSSQSIKIGRVNRDIRIAALLNSRFKLATPLRTYAVKGSEEVTRVTMVTDSIARSSLLGGVGTALIFCTMLANRLGASLRLVTRTEPPKADDIEPFLALCRLNIDAGLQLSFAPIDNQADELDIASSDLFVTTSWWSTEATLAAVTASSVIYFLQEDERMFYPFGDDRHRCNTIMSNQEIQFIVNTELLFEHLLSTGLDNIASHGDWFEPAFPHWVYQKKAARRVGKRKLFFYARPDNPRNLFYLGIDVLDKAIQSGALDLSKWDVYLVGYNIPDLEFTNGYQPICYEGLTWQDYAALIGTIDLGLSLMSTPHPSYPPLDLVASGALVVTNNFLNKKDLNKYSPNVICADLELDSLVDAISKAVILADNQTDDRPVETESFLNTDWYESFDSVIKDILTRRQWA